ncbi:MAG TPA: WecB/TagA/CpsF family glycosyltransferase [Actinomycetes bacterium]|nr:WecB/TagA/CpsF family glycosyltransferase [Actinomycetes bacterium]
MVEDAAPIPHSPTRQRTRAPRPYARAEVMGVPLDACSAEQFVATVERWVDDGDRQFAVPVNAHLVNLANRDPELAQLLRRSGLNYADGQSVVWAARLLGHPVPERVPTTEMIYPIADMLARRRFPVFLLGGRPQVVEAAARRLRRRRPGLEIAGTQHGYFDAAEDRLVLQRVNDSRARVLLVGLGNPKQEKWVWEHLGDLRPNAILTCGGLYDWVSGRKRRAPAWLHRIGLEWLWRLLIEPRRLFRRYVVGNPQFCLRLARTLWGRRGG